MSKAVTYIRDHYADITRIMLLILSVLFLAMILPKEGKFKYEYQKGKPWLHEDLIAPFDFPILKTQQQLDTEKEIALQSLRPFFRKKTEKTLHGRQQLEDDFETRWKMKGLHKVKPEQEKRRNLAFGLALYDTIMQTGVLERHQEIEGKPSDFRVMLLTDNVAEEKQAGSFFTIQSADKFIQVQVGKQQNLERNMLTQLLQENIFRNIEYDAEKSEMEQSAALNKISITHGLIQTGERIISKGELITNDRFQLLESLRYAYENKLGGVIRFSGIVAGQIILLTISVSALFLFLYFFRRDIYLENKKITLILILITGMVYIARVIVKTDLSYIHVLPVCLIPIVVRVFYDTRLALFVHLISIIIIGFLVPNSFEFVFLQLFAGIVTILSIVKLQHRSQFFLTSLIIFLTYSLIYAGMTLIQEGTLRYINYHHYVQFGLSAILTLFSYPVIFLFEKVFGLITDVTMMELSNTNNPLLRELALKAPGTFQHSMQLANLAEEAAYTVGGNPLLVRTGAMYHDIGKMDVPLYFIENQTTGVNPHDDLTYEESARIITNHVHSGVELAKKNKLPEQIIDFIRTHHGEKNAEYFFTLQKREYPDEDFDERPFQYPGPNPFSKETAILMMADAVEAASRSLRQPDEQSVGKLVDTIIDNQMANGLFNNADITLRDISQIKKIFKRKLMSIYHLRIEYPV